MPLPQPLNNNCLIEVIKDYADVARFDGDSTSMSYGRLIQPNVASFHLTASAALRFSPEERAELQQELNGAIGAIVRWEEFAEGGQTFEEDGKTYALVPWWRLIAITEEIK